ncbi:DoxX family protein [Brevundimonas sp.]|uniref:DoxX family protein n=1 Tax=Brevundimonas sp. TaxID=1871086 RepID=UPI001E126D51|nr:DoxX family protein [Brevundimonas sp.]MBA4001064.1 DoxX family protein [Brevundimonas sp.]
MIDISRLNALQPAAMLALRLYVGGFLIQGVWDNITSAARMAEFEAFLAGLNCPLPAIAAPVSVWVQFAIGLALIPGVLTRWAGLLLSLNFMVAVGLLWGGGADARGLFPPAILIFVGLILATYGAGRWSLDARRDKH